jgi:3-deoxy-D-manno-octulosonate 8-phosphate phosphatase (KDO 8-P phosphatase)
MTDSSSVQDRAKRVKLLLMDCDGVLTDGRIWIMDDGEDQKAFSTKDGLGVDLLHRAGLKSGIISGRKSRAVERRARALGIEFVKLGDNDKVNAFEQVLAQSGLTPNEVAFVGDDLNDIPLMLRSGLAIAVADATAETRERAHYVTNAAGGSGAVRESVELILKAQDRWAEVIEKYL